MTNDNKNYRELAKFPNFALEYMRGGNSMKKFLVQKSIVTTIQIPIIANSAEEAERKVLENENDELPYSKVEAAEIINSCIGISNDDYDFYMSQVVHK